jgi:predicted anti-sigma-YlaC factor YlaD
MITADPKTCERARMWASLSLDGELSELERALLDAHLARCAPCAGFVEEVRAATQELRAAEPELPGRPIAVSGRRRLLRPIYVTSAAAALAFAVGLGAVVESIGTSGPRVVTVDVSSELNPVTGGENLLLRQVRLAYIEGERARDRERQRGLGITI